MKRTVYALVVAGAIFASFTACGGGEKVGEAFKKFEGSKGGERIGEIKTTPSPNPAAVKAGPKAATPAPAQSKAPEAQAIDIKITSSGFNPTSARVYKGSNVKITNIDNKPHTYTSSDGTYDSGSVSPGQSTSFVADTAGNFQIEDRTRNWILGSLEVISR